MEAHYKIGNNSNLFLDKGNQEPITNSLYETSSDKTSRIAKDSIISDKKIGEDRKLLPKHKAFKKKKSGFVNYLSINKNEKKENTPKNILIKTLKEIQYDVEQFDAMCGTTMGYDEIERVLNFLNNFNDDCNEKLLDIQKNIVKNYYDYESEKRVELFKPIFELGLEKG